MKKSILFSLMIIVVFSSCKKNDDVSSRSFRVDEIEDIEVNHPHSIVIISNNADQDDALIEKIYTGVSADKGGKFPIRRGMNTKVISTNLGVNNVSITICNTGAGNSISITDSDSAQHSKKISGAGYEALVFEIS